jgi:hypothetical protein
MTDSRLEILVPRELLEELERIAAATGLRDAQEAAVVGLAEWVGARKAELDNRDPSRKYFINEALDELLTRRK